MHKLTTLFIGLSLFLLAGCAPHPSSGQWAPAPNENNASGFVKIDVQFEGRADFYQEGIEKAVRHCFWGGISKNEARMKCSQADSEVEETYILKVGEDGSAVLSLGGKPLGRFIRLPQ